jgi:peptidoglycan/LPS O-acetylase OafA/YrhL
MAPLNLDATVLRAVVTGAAFGLVLYLINFFVFIYWFPWLAELRGWATIAAHLAFGVVAALLYWKLGERQRAAGVTR